MSQPRSFAFQWAAAAVASLALASPVSAATLHCATGDVSCLIAAVNQANAHPHQKTTVRLSAGTYALTSVDNPTNGANGLPTILGAITIEADHDGATLTRAPNAPNFRLLHVGPGGNLTLDRVNLSDGVATGLGNADPLGAHGGALLNDRGTVTIGNCLFKSNSAPSGHGAAVHTSLGTVTISDTIFDSNGAFERGALFSTGSVVTLTRTQFKQNGARLIGGFWTEGGETHITQSRFTNNSGALWVNSGIASIKDTTFEGNGGESPAAIWVDSEASVVVRDSAFVGNFGYPVGVLVNHGITDVINTTFAQNVLGPGLGIVNRGQLTLSSTTIAENTSGDGGVLFDLDASATTRLQNTLIVHSADDLRRDCGGALTSLGTNLIDDPATCNLLLQPTDLVGEAGLGALVDNGDPGDAHYPLLSTSQAIDAANQAACTSKDQIGQSRRAHCDIGAVEFGRHTPSATTR